MGEQQSTPVVSTSTYLDLSNHSLDTLHNLSQFSNLQNLNLSHNYLTTIDSLSSLCNLTSLDTSYNQLIYLPELLYLNISNLQILKSNNNQITNVSPLIVSLQSLVNLNFSRNLIQQIPDTLFSCSSLTFLNFSFNRITDVPPTIGDLVQLKALVLDHNLISHLPPSLGKCCELTMLNLGENELKELPECITLCTNLVKLYVDNNDLQKVPIQISKLQLLKELNLRSNALQVLPLEITKLTSLVMCDVGDNQFGDKFYSTEPAVTDLFERLVKYQFKTPKRKILSKKDRRLQSLTLQSSIASKTKKKVFDKTDIFSKKTLIRISENEGFSYCRVVPCKKESMNHYDAYVYDDLKTLVVWIGKECSDCKKNKAIALAGILEVEDNLLVQTINYHNATVANDPLMKAFNCQKFDSTPFDNEILFNEYINSLKLYTFYDNDRSVEMKEVEVEILTSELLQSSWSVVLETGVDIFVWVGSFSNNNERNSALLQAESLLSNSGRGKESLCFVLQGNESVFFKEYFHDLALKDTLLTPLDNVQRSVSPATEKSAKLRRSQQSPTLVSQPNQNISVVYDKKEVQSHTRHASIEVKQHLSPKHTKKLSENDLIKTDVEKVDNEQKKHVILLSKADEQTQLFTSPESVSPTSPVVNENVENNIKKEDHIPNNITDDHLIKMARRTTKKKKTAPTKNIAQIQKDLNAQTETANNINEKQNVLTFDDIMQQRQKFLDRQNKTSDNLTENIDSTINPIELPRLFQVKGQRRPIVRQVECSWESLNSGDAYIYDPGKGTKTIYQWHGKSCNRMEKGKAMDVAKRIKEKERIGSRQVTVEEGKEPDAFWKGLNGPPTHSLTKAEDAGKDTEVEKLVAQEISLYLLSYNKQKDLVDMQKVAAGTQKLVKGILNVQQCFLLDCEVEMFVWLGSKCPLQDRRKIMGYITAMYDERKMDCWMAPLYKEYPGGEQVMFKERFFDWNTIPIGGKEDASLKGVTFKKGNGIEIDVNYDKMILPAVEKKEVFIDDGNGSTKIWRICGFDKVPIDEKDKGMFFDMESYIILYTYKIWNKDMHLLFFWQGRRCAVLEKGVSARMTVEFHQTLQNETKEIRVVQSSETRHFLSIFQNRMVIHNGKHNEQQKTVLLYDVRGREEPFIKAIQCDVSADKLCSYGVFILLTSTTQFIWKGRLRNEKYVEFAREIGNVHAVMKRDNVIEIDEGNEPKEFFEAIGGFISIQQPTQMHTDRLYQCSATSGIFKSEEHVRFYQDQLYSNDVMLLDTADAIYVWIGKRSTNTERKYTYKIALEFVKKTKPVEMQKRPVYVVTENEEPLCFTNHFQAWMCKKGDVTTLNEHLTLAEDEYKKYFVKYTYAVLTARTFPKGIDEQALETYLTDEEFEEVFQKSKEEFERLPTWKRNALKKEKKLY